MSIEDADPARGAKVELAIDYAEKGDLARAAGILAGMSREERDEFGPLITAAFPTSRPGEPFGAASFRRSVDGVRG